MASFMAQMLDELMGKDRNADPNEQRKETKFDDSDVCKYFLCGFCPHDLFVNTRADLGPCTKIHDDELVNAYKKSSRYEKLGFEEDFLRFIQSLLSDVDKRIKRGLARLSLNNQQSGAATPQALKEEKLAMLTERINELVQRAEELGCEGKVEEAQGVLKLSDQLTNERAQLQTVAAGIGAANILQPKEMEVCQVCGAFLVVGDAPQRQEEHLMGKQHMGYAKLRVTVDDLMRKLRGESPGTREARLNRERTEREKEREKEREERRQKEEERNKEREERRKRDRERDRERDRDRDRDRERRRGHRSRSRSRDRKRRHRSRSRSRDRHRRRRSRSREHRSREDGRREEIKTEDAAEPVAVEETAPAEEAAEEAAPRGFINSFSSAPEGDAY